MCSRMILGLPFSAGLGMRDEIPPYEELNGLKPGSIVQPGCPSCMRGKACPDTAVGPFVSEPVNVTFCLAATINLKSCER